MFALKKLVAPFFFPTALCFELLLVGLILLWFTRKQRAGKLVVTAGAALLLLFGHSVTANGLLRPLEYRHPTLLPRGAASGPAPKAKWVAVLGGGCLADPKLAPTSQLPPLALARLIEGIRLHRLIPGTKVIVSGGERSSRAMCEVALALGVPRANIVRQTKGRDTTHEARAFHELIGSDRFILVTSASHMPRALAMFRKLGMDAVPAPVGHRTGRRSGAPTNWLVPRSGGMQNSERAFYEYIGFAWAWLRGQV